MWCHRLVVSEQFVGDTSRRVEHCFEQKVIKCAELLNVQNGVKCHKTVKNAPLGGRETVFEQGCGVISP